MKARITGTVINQDLEPLSEAEVNAGGLVSTTDASGRYSIEGAGYGRKQLVVKKKGYREFRADIFIDQPFHEIEVMLYEEKLNYLEKPEYREPPPGIGASRYGVTGYLELPSLTVIPEQDFRISHSYHHTNVSGRKLPSQTVGITALSYGLMDDAEISFYIGRDQNRFNVAPVTPDKTGAIFKYLTSYDRRTGQPKFAAGVDRWKNDSDIFCVARIPFLNEYKLDLVPRFRTGSKKMRLDLGYQYLFPGGKHGLLLEAISNEKAAYKKYNAGYRFYFNHDSTVDLFIMSDRTIDATSLGIGASVVLK